MASYLLGERITGAVGNEILSSIPQKKGKGMNRFVTKTHVFDVSVQVNCIKRALHVLSNTSSKCGPGSILLMGSSPKTISGTLRFANPYEEILKSAALASGASFFSGDSQT